MPSTVTYVDFVVLGIHSQQDIVEDTGQDEQKVEERGQAVDELHEGMDLLWGGQNVRAVLGKALSSN